MRLNKYIAASSSLSRRKADMAIIEGRVTINGTPAEQGQTVSDTDIVTLDGKAIHANTTVSTIILNKPRGYVVSRDGQGSQTIYDLLPQEYQQLNPVGRLDKDSSGLLLLTNNGQLANELTHPSHQKLKIYTVSLEKPLQPLHRQMISDHGLMLEDGLSKLQLERQTEGNDYTWIVTMHEGRNRQIRRTFAALGYAVQTLHRTHFGPYQLKPELRVGEWEEVAPAQPQ
ncbi:MAG TPA: pseudouridine synthase [Candidatus Saccharimonadia bacterium]|nr:pseudouridine synthase [Candidatus Saccharimonadia bacterium]